MRAKPDLLGRQSRARSTGEVRFVVQASQARFTGAAKPSQIYWGGSLVVQASQARFTGAAKPSQVYWGGFFVMERANRPSQVHWGGKAEPDLLGRCVRRSLIA